MRNVKRARQAMADSQAAWNSTMHKNKVQEEEEIVTLYTLAPETLDKPGTVSVGGYWLYSDENVPEQVLREVLVDKESSVAQMQAYRLKIPYITFSEEGLNKALARGLVYRADNGTNGVAFDPIKAAIELSKNKKEDINMAKKPVVKVSVAKKPEATRTEVEHAGMPAPACSALDAILAAPIGGATIVRNTPPKKALDLPEERTEDAIVAGINPDFAMSAAMYKAFIQAFRQALAEEGLVLVRMESGLGMSGGCGEDAPKGAPRAHDPLGDVWGSLMETPKAPAPLDPVGDAWGSMMDEPKAPAKPKSTLVLGPNVGKAPKTPAHDIPGNNGKVPVDTIIEIQTAWKNKTATQAELAAKYNLDDKKVWYLVNRAKSLI